MISFFYPNRSEKSKACITILSGSQGSSHPLRGGGGDGDHGDGGRHGGDGGRDGDVHRAAAGSRRAAGRC